MEFLPRVGNRPLHFYVAVPLSVVPSICCAALPPYHLSAKLTTYFFLLSPVIVRPQMASSSYRHVHPRARLPSHKSIIAYYANHSPRLPAAPVSHHRSMFIPPRSVNCGHMSLQGVVVSHRYVPAPRTHSVVRTQYRPPYTGPNVPALLPLRAACAHSNEHRCSFSARVHSPLVPTLPVLFPLLSLPPPSLFSLFCPYLIVESTYHHSVASYVAKRTQRLASATAPTQSPLRSGSLTSGNTSTSSSARPLSHCSAAASVLAFVA